jgi:hypothetical protein
VTDVIETAWKRAVVWAHKGDFSDLIWLLQDPEAEDVPWSAREAIAALLLEPRQRERKRRLSLAEQERLYEKYQRMRARRHMYNRMGKFKRQPGEKSWRVLDVEESLARQVHLSVSRLRDIIRAIGKSKASYPSARSVGNRA